jgi:hypothetical protein
VYLTYTVFPFHHRDDAADQVGSHLSTPAARHHQFAHLQNHTPLLTSSPFSSLPQMLLFSALVFTLSHFQAEAIPIDITLRNGTAIELGSSILPVDLVDECQSVRIPKSVIYSCFVTLSGCVWTAMHPNMPSPKQSWLSRNSRRAGLFLLGLFAPEFILFLSLKQRFYAKSVLSLNEGM